MDKYRKKINRKVYILSFLVVLLLLGSAATFALMSGKSNFLTNVFFAADHDTSIEENVEGQLNKDVFVKNDSNNPAFVRVRILVSPDDAATLKFRNGESKDDNKYSSDWEYNESDGYYYYLKAVPSKDSTSQLLDSVEVKKDFKGDTFDVTVYEESCVATVSNTDKQEIETIKEAFNKATTITTNTK